MLQDIDRDTASKNSFDYSALDDETLDFVTEQAEEIRSLMKRTAQNIIEVGQKLLKIKQRLGYGRYRKWIEAEFNWSKSTANSFENVAKQFANVQNLDIFTPSVLYELAAPSTPESARQEAIARAKAGEKIDCKSAREIKKKHIFQLAQPKLKLSKQLVSSEDAVNDNDYTISVVSLPERSQPTNLARPKVVTASQPKQPSSNIQPQNESETTDAESWWQLGENHLLYCGDPHSANLPARLPERIALAISFPPTPNWNLGQLKTKVNSSLILYSQFDDVDLKSLREIVRNALELYTSERETVIFSFMPDPALLLLAEQLNCSCLIAEPDIQRCKAAIQAWTQTGGKVSRLRND